ncbi:hypothetical protein GCM10009665_50140 [Kitasatospora nipponensis]|uniref:Immunity protein 49 of polymorphic toxin system n=1 Tax=Kitasatospora nipponensis TaxID=258049 RepID=A0ABN1WRY8_9ACTN
MHELEPAVEAAEGDPQWWWEADAALLGNASALDVSMYWAHGLARWAACHDPRVAGADLEAVRALLGLAIYRAAQGEGVTDPGRIPTLLPLLALARAQARETAEARPLGYGDRGRLRLTDRALLRSALEDPEAAAFEALRKEAVLVLVANTDHARTLLCQRGNDATVWKDRPLITICSREGQLPDQDLAWDWYSLA